MICGCKDCRYEGWALVGMDGVSYDTVEVSRRHVEAVVFPRYSDRVSFCVSGWIGFSFRSVGFFSCRYYLRTMLAHSNVTPTFTMQITVPPNVTAGGYMHVVGPNGVPIQVQVPVGKGPGDIFNVTLCMQPQFIQQPAHYSVRTLRQNEYKCWYVLSMWATLLAAGIAALMSIGPAFDDRIATVHVHCDVLEKASVSLCMNEERYHDYNDECAQATFIVKQESLAWTSVGKEVVDNVTATLKKQGFFDQGKRKEPMEIDNHIEHETISFPTVKLKGNEKSGGWLDLLVTSEFKENTFMQLPNTPAKKESPPEDDNRFDFILEAREQFPRWLAIILMLLSFGTAAGRVCSFCCRTRFERLLGRCTHFVLFGALHMAWFTLSWVILIWIGSTELASESGNKVIGKKYPKNLDCKTWFDQTFVGFYVVAMFMHLCAGVVLLSTSCCCLYVGDVAAGNVSAVVLQPPQMTQPQVVMAQVVQPMAAYNIEKGGAMPVHSGHA